jgi:hypothetical protein
MKTITTQELVKLAKIQDIEPELYKMSYGDISAIKEKIEEIIHEDESLFSILMRLKSHVMICEDWIRCKEVRKIEKFSSLGEILSYVDHAEKSGRVTICV